MPGGDLGDIWIKGGHHPIQGLDHGYLTAQGRVHIGKFQADIATAHDGDPARQPLKVDRLIAGEHGAAIGDDPRRHKRIGAGGQDHVASAVDPLDAAAALAHRHPLGPLQPALAPHDLHASALQGFGEVGADRGHQLVGVVGDLLPLKAHRRRMDAKAGQVLGIGQLPHPAAGRQQRLGGNAAAVDAGAAHVAGLHDRHPQAVVGAVLGGIKAPIAGTDHDYVKIEGGFAHRAAAQMPPSSPVSG